ncbi:CsbD family protein [Roseomonas genomospecies 6]|uniref:CsbD family protein n=1 Tax=Roseomonas genomospecies 6 TaxID=214106 RepID=A0A9W7TYT7_9PROT|nr:CsbD family protein [Roseomonas genomospecies 6]KAA0681510.1 CsbD family protein [Roseomonas genomospecies 6]
MNSDRITGAGKELKGEVKKQAGDLTGDQDMKNEGRADKAEGKLDKVVGKVKDVLRGNK